MCLKKLIEDFEKIRKEMIEFGLKHGINHPKVLELSQNLDRLHNQIIKDKMANKKQNSIN